MCAWNLLFNCFQDFKPEVYTILFCTRLLDFAPQRYIVASCSCMAAFCTHSSSDIVLAAQLDFGVYTSSRLNRAAESPLWRQGCASSLLRTCHCPSHLSGSATTTVVRQLVAKNSPFLPMPHPSRFWQLSQQELSTNAPQPLTVSIQRQGTGTAPCCSCCRPAAAMT